MSCPTLHTGAKCGMVASLRDCKLYQLCGRGATTPAFDVMAQD